MEPFQTSMWPIVKRLGGLVPLLLALILARPGQSEAYSETKEGILAVQEAQKLIEKGEFEKAVMALENRLNTSELSPTQLVEMYRLLGLAHLYLGNEKAAQKALVKLFQARPEFELPAETPPKVQSLYQRIRSEWKEQNERLVPLKFERPQNVLQGKAFLVVLSAENVPAKSVLKLYFRRKGSQAFHSVEFSRDSNTSSFVANVPAYFLPSEPASYTMEYYLELVDAAALRLAGEGSAFAPLQFQAVPPPESSEDIARQKSSWQHNPWIWVGVGAAAVGLIVGGVVLMTPTK